MALVRFSTDLSLRATAFTPESPWLSLPCFILPRFQPSPPDHKLGPLFFRLSQLFPSVSVLDAFESFTFVAARRFALHS